MKKILTLLWNVQIFFRFVLSKVMVFTDGNIGSKFILSNDQSIGIDRVLFGRSELNV